MYFLIALRKDGTWMVQSRYLNKQEAEKDCKQLMDGIGSKLFATAKVISKNEIYNYGELEWQRNVKFNDSYILNTIYD